MEASCVTHIGICVRDMDKSLAFYRDALGMKVLGDRPTDPTEGGRQHNYKHARKTRRWVSLAYGDGAAPTLTLTSHPGESPRRRGDPVGPSGHQPYFLRGGRRGGPCPGVNLQGFRSCRSHRVVHQPGRGDSQHLRPGPGWHTGAVQPAIGRVIQSHSL